MVRRSHFSSDPAGERGAPLTPDEQTKIEFGRHLAKLLRERNMSQAEFARKVEETTGVPFGRDAVSTYINGRSFPTPKSIGLMSKTLGISDDEFFPNGPINAVRDELPSFEMKAAAGHPGKAWLRVSRMTSFATAAEIARLLNEEDQKAGE